MGFWKELLEKPAAIITWAKTPEELARYNHELMRLNQQQISNNQEKDFIEWQASKTKSKKVGLVQ